MRQAWRVTKEPWSPRGCRAGMPGASPPAAASGLGRQHRGSNHIVGERTHLSKQSDSCDQLSRHHDHKTAGSQKV